MMYLIYSSYRLLLPAIYKGVPVSNNHPLPDDSHYDVTDSNYIELQQY